MENAAASSSESSQFRRSGAKSAAALLEAVYSSSEGLEIPRSHCDDLGTWYCAGEACSVVFRAVLGIDRFKHLKTILFTAVGPLRREHEARLYCGDGGICLTKDQVAYDVLTMLLEDKTASLPKRLTTEVKRRVRNAQHEEVETDEAPLKSVAELLRPWCEEQKKRLSESGHGEQLLWLAAAFVQAASSPSSAQAEIKLAEPDNEEAALRYLRNVLPSGVKVVENCFVQGTLAPKSAGEFDAVVVEERSDEPFDIMIFVCEFKHTFPLDDVAKKRRGLVAARERQTKDGMQPFRDHPRVRFPLENVGVPLLYVVDRVRRPPLAKVCQKWLRRNAASAARPEVARLRRGTDHGGVVVLDLCVEAAEGLRAEMQAELERITPVEDAQWPFAGIRRLPCATNSNVTCAMASNEA